MLVGRRHIAIYGLCPIPGCSYSLKTEPVCAHFLTDHTKIQTTLKHCVNLCKNCTDDIFMFGESLYYYIKLSGFVNSFRFCSLSLASINLSCALVRHYLPSNAIVCPYWTIVGVLYICYNNIIQQLHNHNLLPCAL